MWSRARATSNQQAGLSPDAGTSSARLADLVLPRAELTVTRCPSAACGLVESGEFEERSGSFLFGMM